MNGVLPATGRRIADGVAARTAVLSTSNVGAVPGEGAAIATSEIECGRGECAGAESQSGEGLGEHTC